MNTLAPFRLNWSMKSRPFVMATLFLTVVATGWPDQTLELRLATPFIALALVALPYLFFRHYLTAITERGLSWSGYYTAFIYYLGIIGAPLSLLVIPFYWNQLAASEIPALIFLSAPSGLSVAIAACEVADRNGWRPKGRGVGP